MTFFIVMACIISYTMIGGFLGARHHHSLSKKCSYKNCWKGEWCGHCFASVYAVGLFWPIGVPLMLGVLAGANDKESRVEARRSKQIEEAKHKAELARIAREEDEELDRRLAALENRIA